MKNKRNLRKLVAALRSGKYEQADGYLRVGDKFCCLGVACDLYGKVKKIEWDSPVTRGIASKTYKFLEDRYTMPEEVFKWLSLDFRDIRFSWQSRDNEIRPVLATTLNDERFTFSQIADCIEYEFKL